MSTDKEYQSFLKLIDDFLLHNDYRQDGTYVNMGLTFKTNVLNRPECLPRLVEDRKFADQTRVLAKKLIAICQHSNESNGPSAHHQQDNDFTGVKRFVASLEFWRNRKIRTLLEQVEHELLLSIQHGEWLGLVKALYLFLSCSRTRPLMFLENSQFAEVTEDTITIFDEIERHIISRFKEFETPKELISDLRTVFWAKELSVFSLLVDIASESGVAVPIYMSIWDDVRIADFNLLKSEINCLEPSERLIIGTPGVKQNIRHALLDGISTAYNRSIEEKHMGNAKYGEADVESLVENRGFYAPKNGFRGVIFVRFGFSYDNLPRKIEGSSITAAAYLIAHTYFKSVGQGEDIEELGLFTSHMAATGSRTFSPKIKGLQKKIEAVESLPENNQIHYVFAPNKEVIKLNAKKRPPNLVGFRNYREFGQYIDAAKRHWDENDGKPWDSGELSAQELLNSYRGSDGQSPVLNSETGRQRFKKVSQEYFSRLRESAFRYLDEISPHLLADVTLNKEGSWNSPESNLENDHSLAELVDAIWSSENPHCMVLGEGGMGKTVSLLQLWEHLLDRPGDVIPIFIPLDSYNRANLEDESNWVIQQIGILHGGPTREISKTIADIRELMNTVGDNGRPSVVLLLDGVNEVTVGTARLLQSIKELQEYSSVQIILTSRTESYAFNSLSLITACRLLPLTPKKMQAYVNSMGISLPDFLEQPDFFEVLSNPMMLCLYCDSENISASPVRRDNIFSQANVTSRGEILENYLFSQSVKYRSQIHSDEEYDVLFFRFYLEIILPPLGYKMEHQGRFTFTIQEIRELIGGLLVSEDLNNVFNNNHIYAPLRKHRLFKYLFYDSKTGPLVDRIENDLSTIWCLFIPEGNNQYRFWHQHFRDFFAAKHIQSCIQRGIEHSHFPEPLKERSLPDYLISLLGEINGDQHAVPTLKNGKRFATDIKKTLSDDLLDQMRNCLTDDIGYCLWNVIEILKSVRKDLSITDLSGLDLAGINLANIRLGWDNEWGPACKFDNSIIDEQTLFPFDHETLLLGAYFLLDDSLFITVDRGGISLWNAVTGRIIKRLLDQSIDSHYLLPSRKWIIVVNDNSMELRNAETGTLKLTFESNPTETTEHRICSTILSSDTKRIVSLHKNGQITVRSTEDGRKSGQISSTLTKDTFNSGQIQVTRNDNLYLLHQAAGTGSLPCEIEVWNSREGVISDRIPIDSEPHTWAVSPDSRYIIVAESNRIWTWESETGTVFDLTECIFDRVDDGVSTIKFIDENRSLISFADKTICYHQGERRILYRLPRETFITFLPDKKAMLMRDCDKNTEINLTKKGVYYHIKDVNSGQKKQSFSKTAEEGLPKADYHTTSEKRLTYRFESLEHSTIEIAGLNLSLRCVRLRKSRGYMGANSSACILQSAGGSHFIFGYRLGTIRLWDNIKKQFSKTVQLVNKDVSSLAQSPDGSTVGIGTDQGILILWNLQTDQTKSLKVNNDGFPVTKICFSSNAKIIVTETNGCQIDIWQRNNDQINHKTTLLKIQYDQEKQGEIVPNKLIRRINYCGDMMISPNNELLCLVDVNGGCSLLTLKDGQRKPITSFTSGFSSSFDQVKIFFSSDSKKILITRQNPLSYKIRLFDVKKNRCFTIELKTGGIGSITSGMHFSPFQMQPSIDLYYDGFFEASHFKYSAGIQENISDFIEFIGNKLDSNGKKSKKDEILSVEISTEECDQFFQSCETKLIFYPELIIHGCDFTNLNPNSCISDEYKTVLKQYGARI